MLPSAFCRSKAKAQCSRHPTFMYASVLGSQHFLPSMFAFVGIKSAKMGKEHVLLRCNTMEMMVDSAQ